MLSVAWLTKEVQQFHGVPGLPGVPRTSHSSHSLDGATDMELLSS